ncbi:MAG: response regulator transcription factor [Wenzhouxiangella sp.]
MKTSCILLQECDRHHEVNQGLLKSLGYTVPSVEVIESTRYQNENPSLAIVDIELPSVNGRHAIECVRCFWDDIFIIGLSVRHGRSDVNTCYVAGADVYLASPIDQRAFLSLVQRLTTKADSVVERRPACLVNRGALTLSNGKLDMRLTGAEFRALWHLAGAGLSGLERWELAQLFKLNIDDNFSNALEARIARLRAKFRALDIAGPVIKAQSGVGYMLLVDVRFLP